MVLRTETQVNPGPNALFMFELKVEKSEDITPGWWGLWFGFWLYPARLWREQLWIWDRGNNEGWATWRLGVLGFEINWQRRYVV